MKPVITPKDRLLSIDELDRDILNLAARINAAALNIAGLIQPEVSGREIYHALETSARIGV